MSDKFITFDAPDIHDQEIQEVTATLRSGWLGPGPKVERFEKMFAEYIGTKYAIATNSYTAAIHLSLLAAGIGKGDEVITTPMTFASTANAILMTGAKPVFVDCDRNTGLIDVGLIQNSVTEYTKAVMPVHLYGRPADMASIGEIAQDNNLAIISDAAHAIETKYYALSVGMISDLTCYSFYVTKNVTTGAGGMVTTLDKELADKIRMMANHGMDKDAWKRYSASGFKHYEISELGYEYGMNDIQASIGIHQLERVEKNLERRNRIWQKYNDCFFDLPIGLPPDDEPDTVHARHLYTLMIDPVKSGMSRNTFINTMYKLGIGTGVHYIGLHLQPFYKAKYGFYPEDFPSATYISERTVSLPLSTALSDEEVNYIIDSVRSILHGRP